MGAEPARREEILSRIGAVPALPTSAVNALRLLQDPDISVPRLVTTIEVDPGLTGSVLQQANSPYFGGQRRIGSVKEAVLRLGTTNMRKAVLAAAFEPVARQPILGYDLPAGALWEHSLASAIGTERLALAAKMPVSPGAFTAAILMDVGKVVLGTFIRVDPHPILRAAFELGVPFDEAELQVLGIDHAEVGAALLDAWNLPEEVVNAVRWHHDPDHCPGDRSVADLVHMADALVTVAGIGPGMDGLNYRLSAETRARFPLSRLDRERVVLDVVDEFQRVRGRLSAAA